MPTKCSVSLFKEVTSSSIYGNGVKQCAFKSLNEGKDNGQIKVKRKLVQYSYFIVKNFQYKYSKCIKPPGHIPFLEFGIMRHSKIWVC